jgi:hypothetical protein
MTYEHEDARYVVAIRQPRKKYTRRTGPRGGYMKDAGYLDYAVDTGTAVVSIVDDGNCIFVYSEPPWRGWANPSYVGHDELRSVTYDDDS